ncbi:hypothetical protein SH501x_003299 [Pirellulaceae bacterium SH501]
MNGNYSGPNRNLKSTDIAAIRSLYGARIDVFEPSRVLGLADYPKTSENRS